MKLVKEMNDLVFEAKEKQKRAEEQRQKQLIKDEKQAIKDAKKCLKPIFKVYIEHIRECAQRGFTQNDFAINGTIMSLHCSGFAPKIRAILLTLLVGELLKSGFKLVSSEYWSNTQYYQHVTISWSV